jgi:hypothetical protein
MVAVIQRRTVAGASCGTSAISFADMPGARMTGQVAGSRSSVAAPARDGSVAATVTRLLPAKVLAACHWNSPSSRPRDRCRPPGRVRLSGTAA